LDYPKISCFYFGHYNFEINEHNKKNLRLIKYNSNERKMSEDEQNKNGKT